MIKLKAGSLFLYVLISPVRKVTLIREYCQGPDAVCYNLPTGGFDSAKHSSIEDCARAELSEEV